MGQINHSYTSTHLFSLSATMWTEDVKGSRLRACCSRTNVYILTIFSCCGGITSAHQSIGFTGSMMNVRSLLFHAKKSACIDSLLTGRRRYDVKMWRTFNEVLNTLPMAAIIGERMFCVHGGLSPELLRLDQIFDVPRPPFGEQNGHKMA